MNIRWPEKISNEEIYRRTEITPWSTKIRKRR